MRIIIIAALAALSLNAHSVEYVPDPDVAFDIIQMHDTTTWERVCQSYDGVCDVPEGTYQVKLLDRNWKELVRLRDINVELPDDSGAADGSHAEMLAAELGCAPGQIIQGGESMAWECVDQRPESCPVIVAHYALAMKDPNLLSGQQVYTDDVGDANDCSFDLTGDGNVERGLSSFRYGFSFSVPRNNLNPASVPSWQVYFFDDQYDFESDDDNPPTVGELMSCLRLLGGFCNDMQEKYDPTNPNYRGG